MSRYRLYAILGCVLNLHPGRIRQCQDQAVLSLEPGFILHLQSYDPLIVPACKTKHPGCQAVIGVIPLVVLIHLDARKSHFPDPVPDFLVHIRLYDFPGRVFLHLLFHILKGDGQFPAQNLRRPLRLCYLIVHHRNGTYCPVVGNDRSVSVQNSPSGSLD